MTDTQGTDVITITINGQAVECQPGELLIDAAERTGTYIPRFCYHPRMKPVGMCRMCLVDVDTGRGPGLQPSSSHRTPRANELSAPKKASSNSCW